MATIDLGKISFTQRGTWASGTAYSAKDVVQHTDDSETSSYVAIAASTGQAPSTNGTINSSYWAIFAKGASIASNYYSAAWASGTAYQKGAVVQYTDSGTLSTYLAVADNTGQVPSTNGTINSANWAFLAKGTASVALTWQSVQTSNFTAQAANGYPVDTTNGAITIALPASPSVGDRIVFKDYARTWQTNSITLSPNGSDKFQGSTAIDPTYADEGGSVDIVYIDATKGWLPINADAPLSKVQTDTRFLVIAGGGSAGSDNGGGGGAGGVRGGLDDANGTFTPQSSSTYTIVVGQGGSGSDGSNYNNGSNSSLSGPGLSTITATGGGKGGSGTPNSGQNGGSGGGSGQAPSTGGSGNAGGFNPSEGNNGGTSNNSQSGGSGGGGWGAAGSGANGSSGQASCGHGGLAKISNITGSDVYYAGGGGGGSNQSGQSFAGLGGGVSDTAQKGGGGDGSHSSQIGSNGTANTGGGAGGSAQNYSGNAAPVGGSGVVIIQIPAGIYASSTGSPTITDYAGKKILKFTGSGSFTTS